MPTAEIASPDRREMSPRLPGLDLVRAVAIGWVMIYHASNLNLVPDPDHWAFQFGWIGVDLFFVLSGFLIAGQLLRPFEKGLRPNYLRFCSRRLLRTLPAYVVMVGLYFMVPMLREQPNIQPFWQFATFTENLFFDLSTPKAFSHVWSLCVEEQFYLIFPFAVVLLAVRPSARKTISIIAAMVLGGMILRGYLWLSHVSDVPFDASGEPNPRPYMTLIYYPTWSRLDGLVAGISIALVKIFRPQWWDRLTSRPNLLLITGMIGIVVSTYWFEGQIPSLMPAIFGFPLLAVSIALIVAAASDHRSIIGRYKVPGAAALATGAYSLYLIQKVAFHLVGTSSIPEGWLRFAAAIALALVFGAILYWSVERPFLKLRERLDGPARSSIAKAVPTAIGAQAEA